MDYYFICQDCGKHYDPAGFAWHCDCGGLFDLSDFETGFPLPKIKERPATLWRYREALPFAPGYNGWQAVTLGEGMTPLVAPEPERPNILLKMDFMMPTLSFKDRGAAVLVAKAQELNAPRLIADSSGNAGTAIAAYAARAGLECEIFVPDSVSPKKLKQIAAHGATVRAIPGTREDTAAAAMAAVERGGVFYASHVYNPFFYQGTKTYAYEIWEQLGGKTPEVVVIPVGNGTLLLGAYYGFKDLLKAGLISSMPRFLAIQAENCAPLARVFWQGATEAEPVVNTGTEAEGIAIAAPARHRQILATVRTTGGVIVTVNEEEIDRAKDYLAKRGFYVEPTAAANWAGYQTYLDNRHTLPAHQPLFPDERTGTVVIPLCGAGLKAG